MVTSWIRWFLLSFIHGFLFSKIFHIILLYSEGRAKMQVPLVFMALTDVLRGTFVWFIMLSAWSCIFCCLCQFGSIMEFKIIIVVVWKPTNNFCKRRSIFREFCWKLCAGKALCSKPSSGKTLALYNCIDIWNPLKNSWVCLVLEFVSVIIDLSNWNLWSTQAYGNCSNIEWYDNIIC